jgi:hypothetical protein
VLHVVCPVWKPTWVITTPMAAQARMPSTAGKKPRVPDTLPGSVSRSLTAPSVPDDLALGASLTAGC